MSSDERIVEVWAANLEEEFDCVRRVVKDYPFVSMVRRKGRACVAVHVLRKLSATFCFVH